jgi:hypothetical protein
MSNLSLIDKIYGFIKMNFGFSQPFFLKEIYEQFPEIKRGTVRESIRRLVNNKKIIKAKNGIYELPNPNRILKSPMVNIAKVIEQSYLKDKDDNVIGYRSGINFANKLGLTSQTASVDEVYSNVVSNRRREIKINKSRLIINAPRIEIKNQNYKLLQILDLLSKFEKYSEYDLKQAKPTLLSYLANIQLTETEIDTIVCAYPLSAQVKFYKIGGANDITQR